MMDERRFDRHALRTGAQDAGRAAAQDVAHDLEAEDGRCCACGDEVQQAWGRPDVRCRCTRDAADLAGERYLAEHWNEAVAVQWEAAGVPARFRGARLDTFESREGAEVALSRCRAWAESYEHGETTGGLYLAGPWGAGKTHLAVGTAYRVLERTLLRPLFVSASALVSEVKGGDGVNMLPVRQAARAELLLLDDLGQVGRTPFDREIIYDIVGTRYDEARPTLMTSNLPPDRLADSLGGALASRLHEMAERLVLTATDYRQEPAS